MSEELLPLPGPVAEYLNSHQKVWLANREAIIAALADAGWQIVTTTHGVQLMRLGKNEAQTTHIAAQQAAEPVWIQPNHLEMAQRAPHLCRVAPTQLAGDFVPLYPHAPATPKAQPAPAVGKPASRRGGNETLGADGITLRDYFAAKALAALIEVYEDKSYLDSISESAYQYADAMMLSREGAPNEQA